MRGTLHLAAALATPAGLVVLLLLADSPRRYVGAAIFSASLMMLYTSSASYHLVPWPARLGAIMKRIDHSMIFVFIAGTYTPLCLLVLDYAWGIPMLAAVWSLAGAGVVLTILWPKAPRWLSVGLYLGIGWIGVIPAAQVVSAMSGGQLALLGWAERCTRSEPLCTRCAGPTRSPRVRFPRSVPRPGCRRQHPPLRPHRRLRRQLVAFVRRGLTHRHAVARACAPHGRDSSPRSVADNARPRRSLATATMPSWRGQPQEVQHAHPDRTAREPWIWPLRPVRRGRGRRTYH